MTKFYMGTGKRATLDEIRALANEFGLELAVVQAIVHVEARSVGFYSNGAVINLYEPHKAYEHAPNEKYRQQLVDAKIASKSPPKAYPATSFDRIDAAARIVDENFAAYVSSWGMGQIMGFNYKYAGYTSALAMVKDFAKGEVEQLRGMFNFIKNNPGIMKAAKNKDWASFARQYNGINYGVNKYDIKLAAAYKMFSSGQAATTKPTASGLLSLGSKGPEVKELQENLQKLGYTLANADSDFGKLTKSAVQAFQRDQKLSADGVVGKATITALGKELAKLPKPVEPVQPPVIANPVEVEEIKPAYPPFPPVVPDNWFVALLNLFLGFFKKK